MDLAHTPMSERCIHEIDVQTMSCINCGGSYWVVRNDPRPWDTIKKERQERKAQIQNQTKHSPHE